MIAHITDEEIGQAKVSGHPELWLREHLELSYAEIANVLGISRSAVNGRLVSQRKTSGAHGRSRGRPRRCTDDGGVRVPIKIYLSPREKDRLRYHAAINGMSLAAFVRMACLRECETHWDSRSLFISDHSK